MESDQPHSAEWSSLPDRRLVYEPCQEAIATLYTFLDGELTPERRDEVPAPLRRRVAEALRAEDVPS